MGAAFLGKQEASRGDDRLDAGRADGCLDFAITADLFDPGRVNLFERWESQATVEPFRRSAPRNKHGTAMLSVSAAEYDVADVRPLFGKAEREPAARAVRLAGRPRRGLLLL
jgi:heme-degrading monooxygenase HmoA